ncbi:MAG: AEC family transporter [Chromatiales bacterium]|nr:AEC family transporter [Chromatiales bacterium]
MFQQLLPIIAPVMVAVLIGWGWARSGVPFEREFLTSLVMNIGVPCLILQGIATLDATTPTFMFMVGVGVLAHGACAAVGGLILRALGQPLRSYLPPVVFGNAGNLGLPLCLFAFGAEGLGLALGYYLVGSVAQFVIAPLFQGRQAAWRVLLQTPIIYAAVAGLLLLVTGTPLPLWMANTVGLVGGLAIPLMLLALGHALGTLPVVSLAPACGLAALRLLMGLGVGALITAAFGLEGVIRGVVIIQTAMPVAVFNYLLAARYDRHPAEVAGAIVVSTLLAFLLLPLLLLWALP